MIKTGGCVIILYARVERRSTDIEMDIGCAVLESRDNKPACGLDKVWLSVSLVSRTGCTVVGRVSCDDANSMTFMAFMQTSSLGMLFELSTSLPNVCAFRTRCALSAEYMVQSFSQKLFSLVCLLGWLGVAVAVDAALHCILPKGRGVGAASRDAVHNRRWRAGGRIERLHI